MNSTSKITSRFLCKNLFNQLHNQLHSLHDFLLKILFLISPKSHFNVIMANARPFRTLSKLSDEERAWALGRIEAGIHPQDVANQFNVHGSTII